MCRCMPGRSFRIGRIAGIPVGVSPWWLLIVALFTWTLGASYYPEVVTGIAPVASYGLGLASVLLLFLSILAHEFGHALVARRHGIEIEEIDLWLLGGVSRMRGEAHAPGDELRYAIAGPAVTAVIGACFGAAALLLPDSTPKALLALIEYEAFVNAAILVLNLMPAFPLDGGRVLRALLWRRSGRLGPATERAAAVGRGFGYLLIVLGVIELLNGFPEGLWFALIGFFIVMAAGQEVTGTQLREAMSGVHAVDLMSRPALTIPLDCTVGEAAREFFARYRYTAYPVVDEDGRAVGMLDLRLLESEELHGHEDSPVGAVAGRDPDLLIAPDLDVVQLMERPAFARAGRAVVVDDAGFPQGLISITDVQRALWMERFAPDRQGAKGASGGRAVACMVGATVALLAGGVGAPGSARASWSSARAVPLGRSAEPVLGWPEPVATDPRGDVAVLSLDQTEVRRRSTSWYDSSLYVTFVSGAGKTSLHRVWRHDRWLVAQASIALDSHGELTLAWVEAPSSSASPVVVRAVRRSPGGRWSTPQLVARGGTALRLANPMLAVSGAGTVLLTWNGGSQLGVRVAWRRPGHDFGAVSTLGRAQAMLFPTPRFDSSGAAHVYGIVGCGGLRPGSRGVMLSAPAGSRRFEAPQVIAPPPAQNVTVSFQGHASGLIAWTRGECSTLEPPPPTVEARELVGGVLGPPAVLDPYPGTGLPVAVATGPGEGTVAWMGRQSSMGALSTFSADALPGGAFASPVAAVDGVIPVGRDEAGDLLLEQTVEGDRIDAGLLSPVVMQPQRGAPEPSPVPVASSTGSGAEIGRAVALPSAGNGAAVVWQLYARVGRSGRTFLAVWRPGGAG